MLEDLCHEASFIGVLRQPGITELLAAQESEHLYTSDLSRLLVCEEKPYPAQLAVAGELPAGQVGGAAVVPQHYVRSFWVSREVELAAHGGVSSG